MTVGSCLWLICWTVLFRGLWYFCGCICGIHICSLFHECLSDMCHSMFIPQQIPVLFWDELLCITMCLLRQFAICFQLNFPSSLQYLEDLKSSSLAGDIVDAMNLDHYQIHNKSLVDIRNFGEYFVTTLETLLISQRKLHIKVWPFYLPFITSQSSSLFYADAHDTCVSSEPRWLLEAWVLFRASESFSVN